MKRYFAALLLICGLAGAALAAGDTPTVSCDAGPCEAAPVVLANPNGQFYQVGGTASGTSTPTVQCDSGPCEAAPVILVGPGGAPYDASASSWKVVATSAAPVSHTGNTTETQLASITIPGGTMGPNGVLRVTAVFGKTGTAGTMTPIIKFNGTVYATGAVPAANLSFRGQAQIANRNSVSSQVGANATSTTWTTQGGWGQSAAAIVTSTHNTALAQSVTIHVTLGSAADTARLEAYLVEVFTQG